MFVGVLAATVQLLALLWVDPPEHDLGVDAYQPVHIIFVLVATVRKQPERILVFRLEFPPNNDDRLQELTHSEDLGHHSLLYSVLLQKPEEVLLEILEELALQK